MKILGMLLVVSLLGILSCYSQVRPYCFTHEQAQNECIDICENNGGVEWCATDLGYEKLCQCKNPPLHFTQWSADESECREVCKNNDGIDTGNGCVHRYTCACKNKGWM